MTKILSLEENQLALLRNLRFKHFFVAVTSAILETTLGRKVAADTVAFSPIAGSISTNSIEALVAGWSPVVEAVLAYVCTKVNPADYGNKLPIRSIKIPKTSFLEGSLISRLSDTTQPCGEVAILYGK